MFKQGMSNPYLELQSTSNGHKHLRYLIFGEISETISLGGLTFSA